MTDRLVNAVTELIEALREEARTEAASFPRVPERLLSVEEAGGALGLGRSSIYAEMGAGRLRSVRVGRRRLVPAGAVAEFIARAAEA